MIFETVTALSSGTFRNLGKKLIVFCYRFLIDVFDKVFRSFKKEQNVFLTRFSGFPNKAYYLLMRLRSFYV